MRASGSHARRHLAQLPSSNEPRAFDTAKDTYKRESLSVKIFSVSISFLENETATARVSWREANQTLRFGLGQWLLFSNCLRLSRRRIDREDRNVSGAKW